MELNNRPNYSRTYKQDTGDKLYRRSLYTAWKRTSPPPSMAIFDAPSRETCSVRRLNTNTPLQALVMQNDPQFLEAARALGDLMAAAGSPQDGIDLGAKRVLGRAPTTEERDVLSAALVRYRQAYQSQAEKARQLLASAGAPGSGDPVQVAWTLVASTLLNMDEAVTRQ